MPVNPFIQSKVGPQKLPQLGPRPATNQAFNQLNPSLAQPLANPVSSTQQATSPQANQRNQLFQTLYKYNGPQGPLPNNIMSPSGPYTQNPNDAPVQTIPTSNPNIFQSPMPNPNLYQYPPDYTLNNQNVPLSGFNPDETSIFQNKTFFGKDYDPYDVQSNVFGKWFGASDNNAPPPGGVGFRPDDNLAFGNGQYASTDAGLRNFPGFPTSIQSYAKGDNALAANIEEEFIKIAQGWSTGNDAILQQGLDVLTELGFPSSEINNFLGQMRNLGPFGSTGQVSAYPTGSPVVGAGAIPASQATIPEHFNRAAFSEDEARAAILQDLSIERNADLERRGQQQQFLLDQKTRLDEDPLAVAMNTDILARLKDPNSITDSIKEQMFGQLADQASQQEQSQLSSLGAMLGGRGLEGSGIGAGLGAQFAQQRQKSLLDNRRNVEMQQAMQSAQDRAAAQASANAYFQGREGLLGSISNNIASVGIGGGIGQTLGQEAPGMPSEIAMSQYLQSMDTGGDGGLGSILGALGSIGGAAVTGGGSLLGNALTGLFSKKKTT